MMQSKHTKNNEESKHILKMWTPLSVEIDENYKFVPRSKIYKLFSKIIYLIVLPILYGYNKLVHGLKIEGLDNLWKTVGGKIIVSNHIHPMDCTFAGIATSPNKLYFPTIKSNFEIPVICHIIKMLNAIPIPEGMDAKKKFIETIDNLLQKGNMVIFYPEGSMWPYYDKLRIFKKGAFKFAANNMVPIVPMVYTYRIPRGIRRIINRKPLITLTILPAVYPDINKIEMKNEIAEELREQVHQKMQDGIDNKNIIV